MNSERYESVSSVRKNGAFGPPNPLNPPKKYRLKLRFKKHAALASERNITVICNWAIGGGSIRAVAVNTSPISHCELEGHKSQEKDALQCTVSSLESGRGRSYFSIWRRTRSNATPGVERATPRR